MPVVILERFNVMDGDIDLYRTRMLHHIDQSCPKKNNIPVVGPHRGAEEWNWELLVLEVDGAIITLAICIDTIYLYGWKVGDFNSPEPWVFIFGATPIGLEGEFMNLPFDGNYSTLGQPHTISFSRATLISSVQTLYACNPRQPSPQVKPSLLTMILTFCTTLRIKPAYEEIRNALAAQRGQFLSQINTNRELNWRLVSKGYLNDEQWTVEGYGVINHQNVNQNLSVLLWHSRDTYKFPQCRGWQPLELPKRKDEGTGSIEESRDSKKGHNMNRHLSRRRAGRKGGYMATAFRIFKDGKITPSDNSLGYGAETCHMLGFDDPKFLELMRLGGMRGMIQLLLVTYLLESEEGVRFRGLSIPECQKVLPAAIEGGEPLPEALLRLLLTGEVPSKGKTSALTCELHSRCRVPDNVLNAIDTLPSTAHYMTQFATGVMAFRVESEFQKAYDKGIHRSKFWVSTYEDVMNLIARLPVVISYVSRRIFKDGKVTPSDKSLDYDASFCHMLGFDDPKMLELMRLGGLRGMIRLLRVTSLLEPEEGVRFRRLLIPECQKVLPAAIEGGELLPEGLLWLLLTGKVPSKGQTSALTCKLHSYCRVPDHVSSAVDTLPSMVHYMTQFATAVMDFRVESEFKKAYDKGIRRTKFWEAAYEDVLNLVARFPVVTSYVSRRIFKDGKVTPSEKSLDYATSFCHMLGFDDPKFLELMRFGGIRGMIRLLWVTYLLEPEEGVRFRGLSIPVCQKVLPAAIEGGEPLPEALLWLLLTGKVPSKGQTSALTCKLYSRCTVPDHVLNATDTLPSMAHYTTQFVTGVEQIPEGL